MVELRAEVSVGDLVLDTVRLCSRDTWDASETIRAYAMAEVQQATASAVHDRYGFWPEFVTVYQPRFFDFSDEKEDGES